MTRGLLVAGTTSDAGKSLVTAGICRMLARAGVSVAPFKSQNMSNNSMVCAGPDGGGAEIGRAQWLQALAARATPEVAMNPVLLKPGSDRRSHIVLMGRPAGSLEAGEFATGRRHLAAAAFEAFRDLASRFDVVVAEGAGSPAEVNLRAGDYVNLGLAREMDLPAVVVGDIDRGGVLAAMYGTVGLLDAADRALVRGWIVNKFRGDLDLLRPGLATLESRTGVPVLGVLPWLHDVWLDSEDALAIGGFADGEGDPVGSGAPSLRVAVVRLPRISNATDIDALAAEPGVDVSFTTRATDLADADLVVLPGSRATVTDLAWLRDHGLEPALRARVAAGRPVLGVCGGHQMLATELSDPDGIEAGGTAAGLGLLPVRVRFGPDKHLGVPTGSWRGQHVTAYEIHHGVATLAPRADAEPFLDGWRSGPVFGTTWHGAFENDGFRRAFLAEVAGLSGSGWTPHADAVSYAGRREAMLDRLADAVEENVGLHPLLALIDPPTHPPSLSRASLGVESRPGGGSVAPASEGMRRGDGDLGFETGVARLPQPAIRPGVARLPQPAIRPGVARLPQPAIRVCVVGIGADGWAGLADTSRTALQEAGVVIGGPRQLDLLPGEVTAQRIAWPSPLRPAVRPLVERYAARGLVVLASGDPMWHGVGRTLVEELGEDRVDMLPHPSSISLACARMGWPVEHTPVVSLLTRPVETVLRHCHDGARILVLSRDEHTPARVAATLEAHGFGASRLTVLADLGGAEQRFDGVAQGWDAPVPRLNVLAIEVSGTGLPETPGLPDDTYDHDGQLTKREVRSVTLSALAPRPGQLLWDVGGGAGSIAIEWLRAHPTTRALAVEQHDERAARIVANAAHLGVPELEVVRGSAPDALAGLRPPDAVFIGGGLTVPGVVEACWAALRPGGRLVANAVTLESQADLVRSRARFGGTLTRIDIARSTDVGRFTGWRPAMPVVQWTASKPDPAEGSPQ